MKQFLQGFFAIVLILILIYAAVLFTGFGDTWIYKNIGVDVTGSAREKYHNELDREAQEITEKVSKMPRTTVEVDSAKYNFGKITEGDKVQHTYKLKNTGTAPLVIAEVRVGCGCTVASYSEEPVAPGEVAEVSIIFDSTAKEGHTQKALHVFANIERIPMALAFEADVERK